MHKSGNQQRTVLGGWLLLTDTSRAWHHKWLKEGRIEGLKEGETQLLKRQLARRFGPLSQETLDRLSQASRGQLETWGLNLLDAATLDEVFRD